MNPPRKKKIPSSPQEWLVHAKSDLKLASLGLNQDVLPEQICFHAQQSVEKALKAVLLFYKIDFPFTHDIEELLDTFEAAGISIPSGISDVGILTPYAVETRYPGYWGEISESEVAEAISFAEKTIKWAETIVKKKEKRNDVLMETKLRDIKFLRSGKVRDIYELDDYLLIVATDRVSAFDVVLPNGIPEKGRVLTKISLYWFNQMKEIIENHIIATDAKDYPEILHKYKDVIEGRSMLVRKAKPLPVECIVRGYLSGSGWKEYKEKGTVCGIKLPEGLVESSRLDEPIFTPSTKADEGHDINISFDEMKKIVGVDTAERLKMVSLEVYKKARGIAEKKGIIIADTKMEFGIYGDKIILIDELLTPDSSRFWSIKDYKTGKGQDSYDKQIVRDYLLTLDWDKKPPAPMLPDKIVKRAGERYKEILKILTK